MADPPRVLLGVEEITWNGIRRIETEPAAGSAAGAEPTPEDITLRRLIARLKDEHWLCRRGAARALAKLGDPRCADALAEATADKDDDVRWPAAEALVALGDPRGREFFIHEMGSPDEARRWTATWSLRELALRWDMRAVEHLKLALDDPDSDVRELATASFRELQRKAPEPFEPARDS